MPALQIFFHFKEMLNLYKFNYKGQMKKQIPIYFIEKVKDIFIGSNLSIDENGNIEIDNVNSNYVTFENLEKLSKLFNTTKINTGMYITSSGCPTCGDSPELVVTIEVLYPDLKEPNE